MSNLERISPGLQRNNGGTTALAQSQPRSLSSRQLVDLVRFQSSIIASYPNQEILPGTPELWREEWSEIILDHGTDVLEEALRRHRKASSFLPSTHDVHLQVQSVLADRRGDTDRKRAQSHIAEMEKAEQQWRRENPGKETSEGSVMRDVVAELNARRAAEGKPALEFKTMEPKRVPVVVAPVAPEADPCPHCGNRQAPVSAKDCKQLAAYYTRKAEALEPREVVTA